MQMCQQLDKRKDGMKLLELCALSLVEPPGTIEALDPENAEIIKKLIYIMIYVINCWKKESQQKQLV